MARYRIRTKQFCQLSQEQKWQSWLQSVSLNIYVELMEHLKTSRTCRSNHIKMMDIQKKLEKRKLLISMINFLRKEYPSALELIEENEKKSPDIKEDAPKISLASPNNKIFKHYNPHMLTFPQKAIIVNDNLEALQNDVRDFIDGKIGIDYIIIGNSAYIEYFKLKYSREADMIPPDKREIYLYRLKNGLGAMERVVKQDAKI